MTPVLLALACTVTVGIEELRDRWGDQAQRACGPGIRAVSITGDHDRLVYEIQYEADWKGREVAHTVAHTEAARTARESCEILRGLYPAKVCLYFVRDGKGRAICATEVAEDSSGKTGCAGVVGEDDDEQEGTET